MAASLVVIAADGAPPKYGFDPSSERLPITRNSAFRRPPVPWLTFPRTALRRPVRQRGSYFVDQHLFQDLPGALLALRKIAREFSPDAIVSHAYEGGHIDHDACSFIAQQVAAELSLPRFEFPLYGAEKDGKRAWQQFPDVRPDTFELQLSLAELACKAKMTAEYQTQPGAFSVFNQAIERFRRASAESFSLPACDEYAYEGRQIPAQKLLEKFREFEEHARTKTSD
jgi:LmbE family N-acetylglucosaminyl deacetylase